MDIDVERDTEVQSAQKRIILDQPPLDEWSNMIAIKGMDNNKYSNGHNDFILEQAELQQNQCTMTSLSPLLSVQNSNSALRLTSCYPDGTSQHWDKMTPVRLSIILVMLSCMWKAKDEHFWSTPTVHTFQKPHLNQWVYQPIMTPLSANNDYVHYDSWNEMLNVPPQCPNMSVSQLTDVESHHIAFRTSSESNQDIKFCQMSGNSQILCTTSEADEMKTYNLLPQSEQQYHYLLSNCDLMENCERLPEISNPLPLLGKFLPVTAMPDDVDNRLLCAATNVMFNPEANIFEPINLSNNGSPLDTLDKFKKPCNCTKSQCLKLYCDCFASGEYCSNCNCNNCYNNIHHELEHVKAIKACLKRNPEAFQPKIGKAKTGDVKAQHNKGCNCKRSGCLKNYCECYEAKIMCCYICKCIECKNYKERPDHQINMNLSQNQGTVRIIKACSSQEVVKATCACLLAKAEEAEKARYSTCAAEQMILEEFGRCLSQICQTDIQDGTYQVKLPRL